MMSLMRKVKSNNNYTPLCVSLITLIYLIVGWGRCQVEALSRYIGRTSRCQKIELGVFVLCLIVCICFFFTCIKYLWACIWYFGLCGWQVVGCEQVVVLDAGR